LTQDDRDLHLIVEDPDSSGITMIMEIPDSACALGTGWESAFASARRFVLAAPRGALLEFEGVGFFDFIHNQRGRGPNGFEIHPVLRVRLVAPPR
ncbi:MAG: hypothetical protein SGI84_15540, partial [Gemmatimonadota bacterium]|nr:hypothetical protein [Gemmatimonadota bacterium]